MTNGNSGNDSDSSTDSELGDFDHFDQTAKDPQGEDHPGQELVGGKTPGRGVPELRQRSEHDRDIRPGDPVRDLWGGSWLIAVKKAADTVREYDQQQPDTKKSLLDYEGSRCTGATEEDAVWNCFYLNQNNTLAGGRSGPYGFPESRICRYAYEATDGYKNGRFQEHIQMQVLERVAGAAHMIEELDPGDVRVLLGAAFTPEEAQEAMELAEASGIDG